MRLTLRLPALVILLSVLLLGAGCSGKTNDHKDDDDKHGHSHGPGPHGGVLVEWGKHEFHPEFTVDHKTRTATVYIQGPNPKKASPIAAESITLTITNVKPPLQMILKADPQEGDPKDRSSRFTGKHDKLGVEMDFKGEISGKLAGKPYSGTFEEKDEDEKKEK